MDELSTRRKRWLDFYRIDGKTRFLVVAEYGKGGLPMPMLWYEKKRERIDWAYSRWQKAMEETAHVPDDYVPNLNMITGTEIFAEAMGCRVHYPDDNNPFALACVHSVAEAKQLHAPRWQDTRLAELFEMADKLKSLAGPAALLHLPDIQSPLDIAALVWDKNSFYTALIDEPEAVRALVEQCKTLLFSFLDSWFARYGKAYVAHYPEYYMEGGVTLSEDEVGVISPAMFRDFVLPSLEEMSARYGGLGMHCCADSERQWQNFKQVPGLKVLNLNRPIRSQKESWRVFCGHVALYPYPCGDGPDYLAWPGQYPQGSHAVLSVDAKDRTDARDKVLRLREAAARMG